jgi:beta-lactamase superfamily II metal-dependent hydrolase
MNFPRLAPCATALLLAAALTACSDSPAAPDPAPPVITVSGVEDGVTYSGPVTVAISVDRGSWEAQLNGAPFTGGTTVSQPAAYTLTVTARAGTVTATRQLSFTIAAPAGGALIIRLIDLGPGLGGGGDAILVTDSSAAGQVHAVIDAGPGGVDGTEPSRVAQRLAQLGVDTLSFMLLTHAHADHFDGMPPVLNSVRVRRFYYNGQVRNLTRYQTTLTTAAARADSVIIVRDTIPLAFGMSTVQSRFTLIPPLGHYLSNSNATAAQLNEGSLGASLRRGSFSMFFTGDGEYEANARWRTQFAGYTRNIDVLKVGHHGANNAIFDSGSFGPSAWLDHTTPSVAVISANGVSHPRIRALTRLLEGTNRRTYCTSVHGEITIRVWSDATYQVSVQKAADSDCVPGSAADT